MQATLTVHTLLRLHSPVILCLHSVGPGPDALPAATFRTLLDRLMERGYQFLTADQVTSLRVLRPRTVLLTFDDGRQDNCDVVLPILREYGIAATFYVCPGLAGARQTFALSSRGENGANPPQAFDIMDWDAMRTLRDSGMCIGCHSENHRDLTECTDSDLDREIAGSKLTLERELRIPIRHFSYPWGRFDGRALKKVRAAGYETAAAVSTNPALPLDPWDAHTLPRVTVHPEARWEELLRLMAFPNMARRTLSQFRRAFATWIETSLPFAGFGISSASSTASPAVARRERV